VRGIPTLMVFKNGQVTETKVGSMSKSQLTEWANGVI
jgi:thioredoxin 1